MGCSEKAAILGHHLKEFSPPTQPDGRTSLDKAKDMVAIAIARGGHRFEWVHRRRDGTEFPTEVSLTALRLYGKPLLHGIVRDTTERDRSRRSCRESESRFTQLFDSVNDGISVRDAGTLELLDANGKFCAMFGYTLDELKTLPLGSLTASTSLDESQRRLLAQCTDAGEGTSKLLQWEGKRKDGSTFWVERSVSRITVGGRECALAVVRDITGRRKAEDELKQSKEAALRLAQETGIISEIGRIISSSLDIEEVYGRFAEEVGKLIPFDGIQINLVNRRERSLITAYTAGTDIAGRKKGAVFPLQGSVTEEMMRTRVPLVFQPESVEEVGRRFPRLVPAFQAGLRSRLSILLVARDEVIGNLSLWSKQLKAYGERDIRLVRSVASQVAGAIANAQLFSEHKRTEGALRKSEKSYRNLVETSPDAILLHENGEFVYLNPAAVRLLGAGSAEELYGRNVFDMVHPDDRESIRNRTDSIMTTDMSVPLKEIRLVRRDGSTVDVEATAGISYYQGKRVVQVIQRDITDRKRAEEALRESEERYRTAIENSNDGVAITQEGKHLYVNRKFLEMFGYSGPDEILGKPIADAPHMHPDDVKRITEWSRQRLLGIDVPSRYEHKAVHKDGSIMHLELSSARITYNGKAVSLTFMRDVTERKQTELRLRDSEEALRSLINAANEICCLIDLEGTIIVTNSFLAQRFRKGIDQLIGKNIFEMFPKDLADSRRAWREKVVETGRPAKFEDISADGHSFDICLYPVLDIDGRVARLAIYAKDITEARLAGRALEESEARFRQFFDSVNDGITVRDVTTFELLEANKRYCEMARYSLEELRALPLGSFAAQESAEEHRAHLTAFNGQVASDGTPRLHQWQAKRKDGTTFWMEVNVKRITMGERECLLSVVRDITERKLLESQLVQAQKLESIGQLAAGIAHEINTPTQYVGNNIQFLKEGFSDILSVMEEEHTLIEAAQGLPQGFLEEVKELRAKADLPYLADEIPRAIEQSLEGVERVTKIVRAMKEFSHPGTKEKQLIDLNRAIENTIMVSRNEWKYVSDVLTELDRELPLVPCLADEFNQVILNLIVNAAHAIAAKNGTSSEKGSITVSTAKRNGSVEIRISDTGPGIPEAIRSRIFDPFFTTKEVGKGTGQGLAIARSIVVDKHGGSLTFETALGAGTTFLVRLHLREEG